MEETKMFELSPNDWEYLNEGNLHIILSYKGKDHAFAGKVLQICKSTQSRKEKGDLETILSEKLSELTEELFYPSTGLNRFRCLPVAISISSKEAFLKAIANKIEAQRPVARRIRQVDLESNIKYQDDLSLSYLSKILPKGELSKHTQAYVIEIKPKSPLRQLFSHSDIEGAAKDVNMSLNEGLILKIKSEILDDNGSLATKYSKVQLEKLSKNKTSSKSNYDPRDFYRSDTIEKALNNLYENPQNNLRAYKLVEKEGSVIKEDMLSKEKQEDIFSLHKDLMCILKLNSIILSEILTIQRIFFKESSVLENYAKDITDIKEALLKVLEDPDKRTLIKEGVFNWYSSLEVEQLPVDIIIEKCVNILNFLISLTWKDFSILINIVRTSSKQTSNDLKGLDFLELRGVVENSEGCFYKLKIIDTDLKPLDKIIETRESEKDQLKLALSCLS